MKEIKFEATHDYLRAQLTAADAQIARLEQERDAAEADVRTANRTIIRLSKVAHAAGELARYDSNFAYPGDEWVSRREHLIRAVVTAVNEEGTT